MPWELGRSSSSRPLLALLVTVDLTFIVVHVWLWSRGQLGLALNLEADASLPEWFQYLKWLTSVLACAYAFQRGRSPVYLAWAMLFAYFLLDDAVSLHERIGSSLTLGLELTPALALRGQDFGELIVSSIAGSVFLGLIAWLNFKSEDDQALAFTRLLVPWLGLLILCGVAVDLVHIQIATVLDSPPSIMLIGAVEDGGEMIAASFLTAISVGEAMRWRSETVGVSLAG